MPVSILITGVFGTGKTTLAKAMAARLRRTNALVRVAPDVARSSPFPLNLEQTDETTRWLLLRQLLTESEVGHGDTAFFLADRGVIDILAHMKDAEARNGSCSRLFDMFLDAMKASVRSFDIIFRTSSSAAYPPVGDGVRLPSIAYQHRLDRFHDLAVELLGATCVPLPDGLERRLDIVSRHLEGLAKR